MHEENDSTRDTAGVILPPPLILAATILAGFALEYFRARPFAPDWGRFYLGPALILAALVLAATAIRQFRAAGTSVEPWKPSTAIVTTGIFARTRNPMYLAMALLLAGIGLSADTLWLPMLLPGFVGILHYGVILREEAYLERRFGAPYNAYRQRVRRWF